MAQVCASSGVGICSNVRESMAEASASSVGVVLHRSAVDADGRPVSLNWKAWHRSDLGVLRWELRRILPCVGYVEKSENTKVSVTIKTQLEMWAQFFIVLGLDIVGHYGRSRHSMATSLDDDEVSCCASDAVP